MSTVSPKNYQGFSQFKLLLALSRTHHGVLDLATPCLSALLWLGHFPSVEIIVLGLGTAFAGYTAVYALNDLVDYRSDQEKIHQIGAENSSNDLDAVYVRHPLAQGLLTPGKAIAWTVMWAVLALVGAFVLNPVCALIFLFAAGLEATYCLLLRITSLRTLVSGVVKTSGGIAAVFAVDTDPAPLFLIVLFFWVFFWEVGGQNIPNDWVDRKEDRGLEAKTVPIRWGLKISGLIVLVSLVVSVALSLTLPAIAWGKVSLLFCVAAFIAGVYMLLIPAYQLERTKATDDAARLFGRASYYPLVMLVAVAASLFF